VGRKTKPHADKVAHISLYPKNRDVALMKRAAKHDGHAGDWRDWLLARGLERAREIERLT